jgi:Flp pilus assembly pilin Flp
VAKEVKKMVFLKKKTAQSVMEYAVLIGLIGAAIIAMQTYVKRGLQGKIATAVDSEWNAPQYEPYYLQSARETERTGNSYTNIAGEGAGYSSTQNVTSLGSMNYTAPQE